MEHLALSSAIADARPGCVVRPRNCDALQALVAARFGVPLAELRSASRGSAAVAFARQVAMYLAHVSFGATYTAIGRAFGRDRTTAAHACRLVEERRDDPRLETLIDRLEQDCRAARPGMMGDDR